MLGENPCPLVYVIRRLLELLATAANHLRQLGIRQARGILEVYRSVVTGGLELRHAAQGLDALSQPIACS